VQPPSSFELNPEDNLYRYTTPEAQDEEGDNIIIECNLEDKDARDFT
jgi:hypothetical protein